VTLCANNAVLSRRPCGRELLATGVLVFSIAGYAAIAPIPALFDAPSRYASVPLRVIVVTAAGFIIVRHLLSRSSLPSGWFWFPFFGFWLLFSARVLVDDILNPAALRLTSSEYLMMGIGMCALPALAVALRASAITFDRALGWLWAIGSFALGANLWLLAREVASDGVAVLFMSRQFTETLNPISFGALGASLVLSSVWSYVNQRTGSGVFRFTRGLALLLGFMAVVASASRGPLFALIVVAPLIVMGRQRFGRRMHRLLRILFLVGVAGFLLMGGMLFVDIESVALFKRLDSGMFEDSARMRLYADALWMIRRDVFFGAGVEPLGWYPHNLILESFLLNGLTSGILFLWMLLYVCAKAIHAVLVGASNSWVPLLFLQYAVGTMFSFSVYSSVQFWVLMASVVAMSRARNALPASVCLSHSRA
jgi:hypothetical protein